MNVGIMSMQRIFNYGSWMQSYGLSNLVKELGHEVEFIDYHIGKPELNSKRDFAGYYSRLYKHAIEERISDNEFLSKLLPDKFLYNEYCFKQNSLKKLLGGSLERNYDKEVDCLIVGSDEVFNCLQCSPRVGFSPELLGHYGYAKRRISYAASFGNTTLEKIDASGRKTEIVKYLSEFDEISVRDENSRKIINELLGKDPLVHLDPVLIWDFSEILHDVNNADEKYMIVYTYPNRLRREEGVAIRKYADDKGLKIYGINAKYDFLDKMVYGSPIDILKCFANAECIVADTFHGTLFSIINHKPFVSIVRDSARGKYGNAEKLEDVLIRLGLSNRIIPEIHDISKYIENSINYSSVDEIIAKERKRSILYLKENII